MKKLLLLSLILIATNIHGFSINNNLGGAGINFELPNGKDQILDRNFTVMNRSGKTIDAFSLVYIAGTYKNNVIIDTASSIFYPSKCVGLTTERIMHKRTGNLKLSGFFQYDTTGFSKNDELFLSSEKGKFTNVAPNLGMKISIGTVIEVGENGWVLLNIIKK